MENTMITRPESLDMPLELGSMFVSFKPETDEQKANLYKAMTQPDRKLSDFINAHIDVIDTYIEMVEIADEESGEVNILPRVVLFTEDGTTYTAVSKGIFNALKRLFAIYGLPHWEKAIPLKIIQTTSKNRKFLNLAIDPVKGK